MYLREKILRKNFIIFFFFDTYVELTISLIAIFRYFRLVKRSPRLNTIRYIFQISQCLKLKVLKRLTIL